MLEGLFALVGRLFAVRIEAADGQAPVWNRDVRFFCVKDGASGQPIAYFYLDAYTRPAEKRGGAWMDEVVGRSRLFAPPGRDVRLPVAHLVCNQTPPIGDSPSLMTFNEVKTLLHGELCLKRFWSYVEAYCLLAIQHERPPSEPASPFFLMGQSWDTPCSTC